MLQLTVHTVNARF